MYKPTLTLIFLALFLPACTLQISAVEPTPIILIASAVPVLATQTSLPPTQTPFVLPQPTASLPTVTAEARGLLYFWPVSSSPDMKLNDAGSFSSPDGYVLEFANTQTGASTVLRAGSQADRYSFCAAGANPYQIRNVEGCYSLGTGAGVSLEWRENGIHYSVGGMGNTLEAVVQFANNLGVLNYQTWQQKFSNAARLGPPGNTPLPAPLTRIQFVPGTTSTTTAYRELATGNFDEYILGAMAGQELTVNVAPYVFADSGNFALTIYGTDGSVLVSDAAQAHFWTGILLTTQDYVIRVANRGTATQYQLNVNIPRRIKFATGAVSTTLDGKLIAGKDGNTYLLQARAGQTMTVSATSVNNNACLTISTMMTDGSFVPLVRSVSQSVTSWSAVLPTGSEYSQDYSILVSFCPNAPATDAHYTLFVEVVN